MFVTDGKKAESEVQGINVKVRSNYAQGRQERRDLAALFCGRGCLGEQVFGSPMQQTIFGLSLALPSLVRSFPGRAAPPLR